MENSEVRTKYLPNASPERYPKDNDLGNEGRYAVFENGVLLNVQK
jgi:hypothetical protein